MTNAAIIQRAKRCLKAHPEVERSLTCYARDIGVSLDNVIEGALGMVARDYDSATGGGQIPAIR